MAKQLLYYEQTDMKTMKPIVCGAKYGDLSQISKRPGFDTEVKRTKKGGKITSAFKTYYNKNGSMIGVIFIPAGKNSKPFRKKCK